MTLAAVDDLDDAFEATRQFLFPVDVNRWLRLAVIAFFVGGAGGAGGGSSGSGGGSSGFGTTDPPMIGPGELPDIALAAVGGLVALLLVVGIAYTVLGAIMEFVLVESLRRETVRLRQYTREYWRSGLRLFGFRLGIGLLIVIAVLAISVPLLAAAGVFGPGDPGPVRLVAALLFGLPVLFGVALTAAVFLGLTTAFVVPVMLLEDTSVLGGWRRFWPTFRAEWREYLVYVLVSFVLRLVAGVGVAIVVGLLAVVVVIPLAVAGVLVVLATGGELALGAWIGLGLLALVAIVAVISIAAIVQVPVVTYFRYYALLVLGDTEADFDVIADRRTSIRTAD